MWSIASTFYKCVRVLSLLPPNVPSLHQSSPHSILESMEMEDVSVSGSLKELDCDCTATFMPAHNMIVFFGTKSGMRGDVDVLRFGTSHDGALC